MYHQDSNRPSRKFFTKDQREQRLQDLKDKGYIFCDTGERLVLEHDYTVAVSHHGYLVIPVKGSDGKIKTKLFSRALYELISNKEVPEGYEVDHKDRNVKNNHGFNLRMITRQENRQNRNSKKNSTSQFRGVTKRPNGWTVQIGVAGTPFYLGYYKSEKLAALCYDFIARNVFGGYISPFTEKDFRQAIQFIPTDYLYQRLRSVKSQTAVAA